MNSTFMGLEIGKRGLMTHQQALHVTGHNISNADNKEYSRQRVVITSADPIYLPAMNRGNRAGDMGQGSTVSSVERIRDSFIDDRIVTEKNTMGFWKSKNDFIYQVESIYNEPSEQSLRSRMDAMWASWQELSKYPEERSTREVVKEKSVHLANEVNSVFRQLYDLREDANRQVEHQVDLINMYAREIRDLNERIQKSEALGDNPNDLKDKRDAAIEKLSTIVNISVGRSDKDEMMVYIDGENLVQGNVFRPLKVVKNPENDGMFDVVWRDTETPVFVKNGELAGLIDVRDRIIKQNLDDINSFAINLADLTNEIHRDGFGRKGDTNINFFQHINISDNAEGNFDLNNDGTNEITAIYKVSGKNKVDASAAIGISGTLTFKRNDEYDSIAEIDYNANDTVNTIIRKINDANLGVSAYIDHNGNFAIKANLSRDGGKKNFMIRHIEDSGEFMVGLTGLLKQSGEQGSFDYRRTDDIMKFLPDREHITITPKFNPASYMAVSNDIIQDVDKIAAARGKDIGGTGDYNTGNGIGDGTNALQIASLRHRETMVDTKSTFNEFYTALVSRIGTQGEEAKNRMENQTALLKNLENMRESVSGVNLDEEMAAMVAYQHGYNAAARVISTIDKMLETVIHMGA